ncbi:MAG: hypothetical protein U1F43_36155 [Myxococcota bacterium]
MTGRKPIIRNAKLHHLKRTVVERQELGPRDEPHVRWRSDLGGAVVVAGVISVSAAAQAAPRDPELSADAVVPPTPAAEIALAPGPETPDPLGPHIARAAQKTVLDASAFEKVSELKENPYAPEIKDNPYHVRADGKRPRIVKKARMTEPMWERVDELKPDPYK